MSNIIKIFILSLAVLIFSSHRSDQELKKIASIKVDAGYFTTDQLENIYLVNGSDIQLIDEKGTVKLTYNNKGRGNIYSLDAGNPLKTLVFYKDFKKILFLDNQLAETGRAINLKDLQREGTSLAAVSHNNGFWLFDDISDELFRYNEQLQITNRSGSIPQLTGRSIDPNFLVEGGNLLFLNDPGSGILIFDQFGAYSHTLAYPHLGRIQVKENLLFFNKNNQLFRMDLRTSETDTMNLPAGNFIDVRTEKEKLYLLKEYLLEIYRVNNEKN